MTKYHAFLIGVFALVWAWAAWEPLYRGGWLLENYLVFLAVPVVLFTGRRFQFSNVSYGLITLFIALHVVGSHYTYGEVPFGFALQEWLGAERNMYDRLVHFSFGLLLAYPIRELFLRLAKVRGFWSYFLPFDVTMSFSGIFEIIEYLAVVVAPPAAGEAFLGMQGDIWDAQKDMALAGIGALLAMTAVFIVNRRHGGTIAS